MKQIFGFIFIVLLLASCNNEDSIDTDENIELENNFTISGQITGGENKVLYLEALSQQGKISVAKTGTNASGSFEMIGNIPGFGLYQLRLGETDQYIIPLSIVPEDNVKITSTLEMYNSPLVEGTSWSSTMTNYMKVFSEFHIAQSQLMLLKDSLSKEELTDRFIALKNNVDDFSIKAMKKNPGNPFNIVMQAAATPAMGFNDWDPKNLDVLIAMSEAYIETFPNSPITTNLSNQVYQIEIGYQQHVANNTGTRAAPEITLKNPEGVEIKLSSLKGKYVLIDFWASWCGPCRKENPNVVKLYHKYKNDGFTIYSVSLDSSNDAWKEAILKDGLVWPNHVSDLMQWNSPMPKLYGFNGIPHAVLINKEGNIIGVGLRGPSLEQKLEEIFGK